MVRVGGMWGILVPKRLLALAALPDLVQIRAEPGRIEIGAARRPRAGWADAARKMRARGDDVFLDAPPPARIKRVTSKAMHRHVRL
jgi:antitoxin MazE